MCGDIRDGAQRSAEAVTVGNTVPFMIYLLLIVFPLAAAGASYLLRRDAALVSWLAAVTLAAELWLAASLPLDQPGRLLEIGINYNEIGRLFLILFCLGSLTATLTSAAVPLGEHFAASLLLILSTCAAILVIQEPFAVAILLLLASLVGALQLVDQPVGSPRLLPTHTIGIALKYTLLIALGGSFLLIGFALTTAFEAQLATSGPQLTRAVFGLLLIGFGIRIGLIPFHLWLTDTLDDSPPATIFVQSGLLTALAVPVLLAALETQPQLLTGNDSGRWLLLAMGGLSAVGGGILALAAQQTRRAIAFLVIANLGLLTIGFGLTTVAGVGSAVLGALNHIASMSLIVVGLALLERPVPGRREQAGAMRERPLAALALLLGVLLLVGMPPLSGFVPKLMLLSASAEQSALISLLVVAGLVLNGLAAGRLLSRALLRPKDVPTTRALFSDDLDRLSVVGVPYAPRALLLFILLLAGLSLAAGLWPYPIVTRVDEIVRGLAFVQQ